MNERQFVFSKRDLCKITHRDLNRACEEASLNPPSGTAGGWLAGNAVPCTDVFLFRAQLSAMDTVFSKKEVQGDKNTLETPYLKKKKETTTNKQKKTPNKLFKVKLRQGAFSRYNRQKYTYKNSTRSPNVRPELNGTYGKFVDTKYLKAAAQPGVADPLTPTTGD